MKDFFISYTAADRQWAEWIATALVADGRTVTIQAWDFLPGSNFVVEMHRAASECERTIAVLSPEWLASVFTQPEWAAAFSLDPTGAERKLIPVRVSLCDPPGLLRGIVYCDLVGRTEESARQALLDAVRDAPVRPTSVPFPGASAQGAPGMPMPVPAAAPADPVDYPGAGHDAAVPDLPSPMRAAVALLGLLRTTRTTFVAQAKLRDRLVIQLMERLVLNPFAGRQYEDLISDHFEGMNAEERRLFSTMRSFTTHVLRDYNRRILALIDEEPALERRFPAVHALRDHLLVWLAKYDGTFANQPDMCLLYTGVHEGVPFPAELEAELWTYVGEQPMGGDLLEGERGPPLEYEEHAPSGVSYETYDRLFKRYTGRRLLEIEEERARLLDPATGEPASGAADDLRKLDVEEADLLERRIYPEASWRPIAVPPSFLAALKPLLQIGPSSAWPSEYRDALSATAGMVNNPNPGAMEFRSLVMRMPDLLRFVESTGMESELRSEWESFRMVLRNWVLAGL